MPRSYQFGTQPSSGLWTNTVRDALGNGAYCTAMVTKIRKSVRGHLYIEEWMEFRGLSDEKLANRIGVARETVTRWRGQQHRLNPGKMAAIASALDCEPEELWRPPERPSLDAMVKNATEELQNTAADIVRRLVGGRQ
jgi:DNA-binding Xre family transcriptional regulator